MTPCMAGQQQAQGNVRWHNHGAWPSLCQGGLAGQGRASQTRLCHSWHQGQRRAQGPHTGSASRIVSRSAGRVAVAVPSDALGNLEFYQACRPTAAGANNSQKAESDPESCGSRMALLSCSRCNDLYLQRRVLEHPPVMSKLMTLFSLG